MDLDQAAPLGAIKEQSHGQIHRGGGGGGGGNRGSGPPPLWKITKYRVS